MQAIFVQLWGPGSRIIIFEGSQNVPRQVGPESDFGIFTSSHEEMKAPGITPVVVEMEEGGM